MQQIQQFEAKPAQKRGAQVTRQKTTKSIKVNYIYQHIQAHPPLPSQRPPARCELTCSEIGLQLATSVS